MDPCDRVKFILGVEEEDGATTGTTPHEVFTELDELCMHHGEPVWKETARCVSVVRVTSSSFPPAFLFPPPHPSRHFTPVPSPTPSHPPTSRLAPSRWLKFEEDVEEGGDKWSKPHVATLSLHSLFELRSNLTRGTVMLDLEANNLAHIAGESGKLTCTLAITVWRIFGKYTAESNTIFLSPLPSPPLDVVLDNLVVTGQLEEENREKVREALLIRHRHQNNDMDILRHIRSFADFRKDKSSHPKKADSFEDSTSLQHELEVPSSMGGKTLLVGRGGAITRAQEGSR